MVTGASRGLGAAIARRLAASGASVALWGRDVTALTDLAGSLALEGRRAVPVVAEVTDEAAVALAMAESLKALGRVDILVNNAGVLGPRAPVESLSLADWRAVLETNLTGPFLCSRAATPHLRGGPASRIVNIGSVAGKDGNPFVAAYAASKAGLMSLTKSMAKELAADGILVNAVTPSAADTEIFGEMTETRRAQLLARVPMGRFVKPEEVAALVAWLCSADCSFSTGACFDISGGRSTW